MTTKMKRVAAFTLCLMMVLAWVPALATGGMTITGGFGGIIIEEETEGVVPAGPVLGSNVALELTIGVPKTFSVYGFDYTSLSTFFDKRPDMKIDVIGKRAVPDVFVNGAQVYLYDFTLTAGDLYLDYIYPSNLVSYDGTNAWQISGNWTLKVWADTAPANLVPKGQLLNRQDEIIYAAMGKEKVISYYGFSYTDIKTFFNGNVEIVGEPERFAVPGIYANGSHPVYLYNTTIKMTGPYNPYNDGDLYESNIVYYNNNEATMTYYLNWKLKEGEDTSAETTPETGGTTESNEASEPDLSNVRLVVTSNLTHKKHVKMGTEMVLDAVIEGGEGLEFHIWWQQSTDGGQTWTDIPGAVGAQYREVITRENKKMKWRACADVVNTAK